MTVSRTRNHLLWIGPLVTLAGAFSYFAFFARFPDLRDFPWVNLPLVLLGLGLTIVAVLRPWRSPERFRGKILGIPAILVSGLLATGFGYYVFGLSYHLPAPTALTASLETAPDPAMKASDGSPFRLSELRGKRVVLVFYRGYW